MNEALITQMSNTGVSTLSSNKTLREWGHLQSRFLSSLFWQHCFQYIVYEYWPETTGWITWNNKLQNMCYMCIQWTHVLYSVVITQHSNLPISQFSRPCNIFTSVWSMISCYIRKCYRCLLRSHVLLRYHNVDLEKHVDTSKLTRLVMESCHMVGASE